MSRPPQYETNDLSLVLYRGSNAARRSLSWLRRPIQATGFWVAIALPFLHVPLLLSGLETGSETALFLFLLGLNTLALLLGRDYAPGDNSIE